MGPSVDWALRTSNRVRRALIRLERATLRLEQPVGKAVGTPRLNPLYHTGTISVFLFAIVVATGIYVTFFFQYGFEASYEAVTNLEANFVGRVIRGIHRYASMALVVTSLLHGWRMLFQDRFRGARWVAWVTGAVMMLFVWVIGVTGYWLIWDRRSQALNDLLHRTIGGSTRGLDFLLDNILTPVAKTGWPFILLLFFIHAGLSIGVGALLYYHLKRLNRPLLFPPRYWMTTIGVGIAVVALVWPAGMLDPADLHRVSGTFPLDPFFLFLLPPGLRLSPGVVWGAFVVVVGGLTALPWILRRPPLPPIVVDAERCTGCTLCVADCPYGALEMIPNDHGPHRQLAKLVDDRCVSCGICIGSCPVEALTLGDVPAEELWDETRRLAQTGPSPRIVFTCERHAEFTGGSFLGEFVADGEEPVHVVPVTCLGMVHPDLIAAAMDSGAGEVQVLGCPPSDCANREGNTWTQARIDRTRVPRLKKPYLDAVRSDWVPPTEFTRSLTDPGRQPVADPCERPAASKLVRVGALVALATVLSIAASMIPFAAQGSDDAFVTIALDHQGGAPIDGFDFPPAIEHGTASHLVVDVDGDRVVDRTYDLVDIDGAPRSLAYERIEVTPGDHTLAVGLFDRRDQAEPLRLFDGPISLEGGEVFPLSYSDSRIGSRADVGKSLFFETTLGHNSGCRVCHSLVPGKVVVGPSLDGVATRAASRVPGMSAEDYLRQSIVDPGAYVVDGFPDAMLRNFDELLTDQEIDDLVAFLLTLE